MCNACGNVCCGSDEFGGCGCDGCDEPDCWSDDDDFYEGDEDYDPGVHEFAARRCAHSRFRCVEVT